MLDATELDEVRRRRIIEGFRNIAALSVGGEEGYTLNFRKGGAIGPNAFALPDGTLIVTDELVALAGDDAEMIAACSPTKSGMSN